MRYSRLPVVIWAGAAYVCLRWLLFGNAVWQAVADVFLVMMLQYVVLAMYAMRMVRGYVLGRPGGSVVADIVSVVAVCALLYCRLPLCWVCAVGMAHQTVAYVCLGGLVLMVIIGGVLMALGHIKTSVLFVLLSGLVLLITWYDGFGRMIGSSAHGQIGSIRIIGPLLMTSMAYLFHAAQRACGLGSAVSA